jgi:adenylate cyclase
MIDAIEEFNKELQAEGRPPVGMGAGVNTGPTLIGNIGANDRYGYDVLGDSVSTAARLEGQTKGYGVLLVIGPETAERVKHVYDVAQLDCIAVKGKTIGLHIYAIAKVGDKHHQYLDAYYSGDWKKAMKLCQELMDGDSNTNPLKEYYKLMHERMSQGKPSNWDGVYHATSK